MKNRCVIYARVSVESNFTKKESISNQIENLIKFANDKNYEIIDIYKDDGYSGGTMNRPAISKLLEEITTDKFDIVLTTNLSRFSRNYIDAGNYIENVFPSNNIRFIATGDNYDSLTYNDDHSFAIKIWLNDMYIKDIGNKIRFANKRRAELGYMSAGCIYGLEKVDGQVVVNEKQADVVRLIFKMYLEGYSALRISKYLRENKIYNSAYDYYLKTGTNRYFRGKSVEEFDPYHWQEARINKILANKEYNGVAVNREYTIKNKIKTKNLDVVEIKDAIPKIIDDETFNKVQEKKLNNKIDFSRKTNLDRLDFLYCYKCNCKLRYDVSRKVYMCGKCKKYIIYSKNINEVLKQDLEELIHNCNVDKNEVKKKFLGDNKELANLNDLIVIKDKLDIKITNLFESFISGNITEGIYNSNLDELNNEILKIENNIKLTKKESNKNKISNKEIEHFINSIKNLNVRYSEEDLSIFKLFIERIIIEKVDRKRHSLQISYKFKR